MEVGTVVSEPGESWQCRGKFQCVCGIFRWELTGFFCPLYMIFLDLKHVSMVLIYLCCVFLFMLVLLGFGVGMTIGMFFLVSWLFLFHRIRVASYSLPEGLQCDTH